MQQSMMTIEAFKQKFQYTDLDPQQTAAVAATEGPVLLLAVPGSGKTTTLLARLGYLVYGKGVDPARILTCTYTVAATNEMRARFGTKFGAEYAGRMEFRTINGVCARIIARYEQQGHRAFSLVTDDGKRYAILREAWTHTGHNFPTESDLRSMSTAITYVKNQMLTDTQADGVLFPSSEGSLPIGPVYRFYNAAMRRNQWMDYDDQMVYANAILNHCPEILEQLQTKYTYFCVDEAQDTSRIQHQIIARLAARSRNLLMVGDEDQSIYGFRAACPQALMEFERRWPGARVLFMERNYRSAPQIVTVADRFIRLNKTRRDKHMQAARPDGARVVLRHCDSRLQQYELLADMAKQACTEGRQLAILYRNNDTALPIIDLLDRQGTPYRAKGVDSLFFGSRIFSDVKDLFALAAHPDDREVFLRLYYKLGIYLKKAVAAMPVGGNGESVFQGYRRLSEELVPAHVRHLLAERGRQLEQIRRDDDPAAAIRMLNGRMGYGEYLAHSGIDPFRLDILAQLAQQESHVADFLRRLEYLEAVVCAGGENHAGCVLSTIHSSKGLEYDHVVLADAVIGGLPMDSSSVKDSEERQRLEEEERRLFYVGITRARDTLTILSVYKSASPFVRYLQAMLEEKQVDLSCGRAAKAVSQTSSAKPVPPMDLSAWRAGCQVYHKSFGRGTLLERREEYGVIEFPSGTKTLSLPFAIRTGMLRMNAPER